jgi:uncharacterized protein (DUF433 family)
LILQEKVGGFILFVVGCSVVAVEHDLCNVVCKYYERRCIMMKTKLIGRYIVADPEICHGKPTFRGTRILVADVLEQVADGLAWETIVEEWRGSISYETIAEAVRLSRRAFLDNSDKYTI